MLARAPAGSFDSADLEEEDPDEGVGVDERAALLQPEDFFLDDEDWYASARWLMERPETEDFITAALLTHMAPLYVPYADVRARSPKEVVPSDVQVGSLCSIWLTVASATVLERTHTHHLHAQRAGGVVVCAGGRHALTHMYLHPVFAQCPPTAARHAELCRGLRGRDKPALPLCKRRQGRHR